MPRPTPVPSLPLLAALLLAGALDAAPAAAAGPTPAAPGEPPGVLFDEGHAQRFRLAGKGPLDLSRLGEVLGEAGGRVAATATPLAAATLDPVEVLVVSGAFAPVTAGEIDAVLAFVERGGRLAVLLHIGAPVADLLHRLGVSISNGVIREEGGAIGGDPVNFAVARLARHPLTAGLTGFALFGGWALLPTGPGVTAIAESGPASWVDLNRSGRFEPGDARQSFAVVLAGSRGAGRFVVFGDDAVFQNAVLAERADNLRLARNLARWLVRRAPEASLAARPVGGRAETAR